MSETAAEEAITAEMLYGILAETQAAVEAIVEQRRTLEADIAELRGRLDAMAEEVVTKQLRVANSTGMVRVRAGEGFAEVSVVADTSRDGHHGWRGPELILVASDGKESVPVVPEAAVTAKMDGEERTRIGVEAGRCVLEFDSIDTGSSHGIIEVPKSKVPAS